MSQTWSPADYARFAHFVPSLGAPLLERLAAQSGERILDLGCGDGVLTERLIATGAEVIAVDSSSEMVAAARARGIEARLVDATALPFDREFDAVFSNAVLHWVLDADAALAGIARALKPGGRFVAEFGAHTNVASISVALRAVFARRGLVVPRLWYYPTADEYRARLVAHGFVGNDVRVFSRPTPLPDGMSAWLRVFRGSLFRTIPEEQRALVEEEIVELLRPSLCDSAGNWTADYVRIQVVAARPTR